jgi:hypothetical protein
LMKKCWVEVGRGVFGFVTLAFGKEGENRGEGRKYTHRILARH